MISSQWLRVWSAAHADLDLLPPYLVRTLGLHCASAAYRARAQDAEVAAPEGELRGRLYDERHGGRDDLSLLSCGWRGVGDGGP